MGDDGGISREFISGFKAGKDGRDGEEGCGDDDPVSRRVNLELPDPAEQVEDKPCPEEDDGKV